MGATNAAPAQLEQSANENVLAARQIKVTSAESRAVAEEFVKGINALRQVAEGHHRPMINAAYKAHKEAVAALKRIDGPLAEAELAVKSQIGFYDMAQDRLRRDAERKEMEEARRKQEEEAMAAAEAAKAAGASEAEAVAILEEEMSAPLIVAAPPVPKAAVKQYSVTTYKYRVHVRSVDELLKFVVENPVFRNLIVANATALDALARAQKESFDIPGCQLIREPIVRVRS